MVVDLLIVGGLTVDHFPEGLTAPGGTVLHGARAALEAGMTVGIATVAGEEPEAQAALAELGKLVGPRALSAQHATASIAFRHDETDASRTLTLLDPGKPMMVARRGLRPRAVLYGPVAGELDSDLAGQLYDEAVRAATLQGWLRSLRPGDPVAALGLDRLEPPLVARLATCDLLVASTEDLAAVATEPADQLAELRRRFGPHPILAVTLGREGVVLESGGQDLAVPAPARAGIVSTNGAGDAFAAVLTGCLAAGLPLAEAATRAANAAAAYIARPHG